MSAQSTRTEEKKICKLVISMILSVILFWSPYHSLYLYFVFATPPSSPSAGVKLELAFRAGNVWTCFNPLFNALLYCIFSKEFRSGLASLFLLYSCDRRWEEQNSVNDLARSGQELVRSILELRSTSGEVTCERLTTRKNTQDHWVAPSGSLWRCRKDANRD